MIDLVSGASTWTFSYAYAMKVGNFVRICFRANATQGTTTIRISNFKTLFGEFYQLSSIFYDITHNTSTYGTVNVDNNDLCIVFPLTYIDGDSMLGDFLITLK